MKKCSIVFTAFLCACLVLCLPIHSFAADHELVSVQLKGIDYEAGTPQAQYSVDSFSYSEDGTITLQSNTIYSGIAFFRFRFVVSVDNISSFQLAINYPGEMPTPAGWGSFECALAHWNGTTQSHYTSIYGTNYLQRSYTKDEDSGTTCGWIFQAPSGSLGYSDYNMIIVAFPISAGVFVGIDTFKVLHFTVNNIEVSHIAAVTVSEDLNDTIGQLTQYEDHMWEQVVAPDIADLIEQNNVIEYTEFNNVILAVSKNNFIVPALLLLTFSFAFYGYVLYGRKG